MTGLRFCLPPSLSYEANFNEGQKQPRGHVAPCARIAHHCHGLEKRNLIDKKKLKNPGLSPKTLLEKPRFETPQFEKPRFAQVNLGETPPFEKPCSPQKPWFHFHAKNLGLECQNTLVWSENPGTQKPWFKTPWFGQKTPVSKNPGLDTFAKTSV